MKNKVTYEKQHKDRLLELLLYQRLKRLFYMTFDVIFVPNHKRDLVLP